MKHRLRIEAEYKLAFEKAWNAKLKLKNQTTIKLMTVKVLQELTKQMKLQYEARKVIDWINSPQYILQM